MNEKQWHDEAMRLAHEAALELGDDETYAWATEALRAHLATVPTETAQDERGAFEAELPKQLRARNEHGDYVSTPINDRWAGWQARAVLAAAKEKP
jgi:hypothetical protein